MDYNTIKYKFENNVGTIQLNRPERMNAVIEEMYDEIIKVLELISKDNSVRALILTGSSFKKNNKIKQAFCAGADLKKHSSGERNLEAKKKYIELAHKACFLLYNFPKPTIAAVNGPARGAGTEMALNCDFIFMDSNTTIAFPESSLGTCAGGGVTSHLVKSSGITKAKELLFTGRILTGSEAKDEGIIFKSFPAEKLMDQVYSFAGLLSKKAPVSIGLLKNLLNTSSEESISEVLQNETNAILHCMETNDWHEGLIAFNEKRPPVFKGE